MAKPGPRWRRCVHCGRLLLIVEVDAGAGARPATVQTVACHCGSQPGEAGLTPVRLLERTPLSAAADAVARRLLASVFPHGLPG